MKSQTLVPKAETLAQKAPNPFWSLRVDSTLDSCRTPMYSVLPRSHPQGLELYFTFKLLKALSLHLNLCVGFRL